MTNMCEAEKRIKEKELAKLTAYDLVRKIADNPTLSSKTKIARINLVMSLAEGKGRKP
jgi:hypothetical protein